MRGKHLSAILALWTCAVFAPSPGLAQQQQDQAAAQAAGDPAVVKTLKKAIDTQGDVSAATLKAVQNDPLAADLVAKGRAAGEDSAAHRAAPQSAPPKGQPPASPARNAGPKSAKAIYGDIIIHK